MASAADLARRFLALAERDGVVAKFRVHWHHSKGDTENRSLEGDSHASAN